MPPKELSIRQRGAPRADLEAPRFQKALDDVPIRNSVAPSRYAVSPSNPRPVPPSTRRPVEQPQRPTNYRTLPAEGDDYLSNAGKSRPPLRPLKSQPQQPIGKLAASASWDLDAAESTALSQPESSYLHGDGSDDDSFCSPTASDIDALEEFFNEFQIQSSQAEAESVHHNSQALQDSSPLATSFSTGNKAFLKGSQTASSANYNKYGQISPSTQISIASSSSPTDDLGESTSTSGSKSIQDRLGLVWRMFSFPSSTFSFTPNTDREI